MNAEMLKDGWIVNDGEQPVGDGVLVDVSFDSMRDESGQQASCWFWDGCGFGAIKHWRLHAPEVALEIPPEHRKSLEDAYDHLNTGNWQDTQPKRMSAAEYIETLQPLVEEQPIGLPLSRVCKAFEAITGHPMSEDHAETFLKVVEMCKIYATENDF